MSSLDLLMQCIWKGTILLAATAGASAILRRRSAALRHAAWTACFAALLLLPVAVRVLPRWDLVPAWERHDPMPVSRIARTGHVRVSVAVSTPAPAPAAPAGIVWPLALWMAGATGVAAWFLVGIARTSWMVRRSQPARDASDLVNSLGIRRRVRVLTSDAAPMPLTWGIARPVVVLPRTSEQWPDARLRTVILHELVHVRRLDLLAQGLGQLACCLFWFHPLSWIAAGQLRKEREQACDDAVLARGIPAPEYAGHLVDLVRATAAHRNRWAHAPAMAEASGLETRVRALLDPRRDRRPLDARKAAAVATTVAALFLPLAALSQAQNTLGAIAGIVLDPSGAVVPNCQVRLQPGSGSAPQTIVADTDGGYRFASLPAGTYSLEVSARGFAVYRLNGIEVPAGGVARVDPALNVGGITESLTVQGRRTTAMVPAPPAPRRIKVGGNVEVARLVRQPRPEYPAELQQLGIEGNVVLRCVISKEGIPLSISAVNSGIDPRLVELATKAVSQWRYQPARLNGEPVEVAVTTTIEYKLGQ